MRVKITILHLLIHHLRLHHCHRPSILRSSITPGWKRICSTSPVLVLTNRADFIDSPSSFCCNWLVSLFLLNFLVSWCTLSWLFVAFDRTLNICIPVLCVSQSISCKMPNKKLIKLPKQYFYQTLTICSNLCMHKMVSFLLFFFATIVPNLWQATINFRSKRWPVCHPVNCLANCNTCAHVSVATAYRC